MLSSIPCNCCDIKAFHSSLWIAADVATPLIQSRLQIAHPDEAQCLQSFTFYLLPAFRSNEIIKEKSKLNDIVWKAGAKEKSRDWWMNETSFNLILVLSTLLIQSRHNSYRWAFQGRFKKPRIVISLRIITRMLVIRRKKSEKLKQKEKGRKENEVFASDNGALISMSLSSISLRC